MINLGFEVIVSEISRQLVPVEDLARQAGLDHGYIERLHSNGLRAVPVSDSKPLFYLIRQAIARLLGATPCLAQRIGGVIYAHSLPVIAPNEHPFLREALATTGLQGVPTVAIGGQPCAIIHRAIQIAHTWLLDEPNASLLIIGADKAYAAEERIFFNSAMGDAVVVLVASRNAVRNRVLASLSDTEVLAFSGELSPAEAIARFRQENPHRIRSTVKACLAQAGLRFEQLDYIVPHTPYHLIWDTVSEILRFPRERILTDYLDQTGHLNSNDVVVHYERAVRESRIQQGQLALLVSPGFGGTRGCTLIRV